MCWLRIGKESSSGRKEDRILAFVGVDASLLQGASAQVFNLANQGSISCRVSEPSIDKVLYANPIIQIYHCSGPLQSAHTWVDIVVSGMGHGELALAYAQGDFVALLLLRSVMVAE